jgi:hypothetical protein
MSAVVAVSTGLRKKTWSEQAASHIGTAVDDDVTSVGFGSSA